MTAVLPWILYEVTYDDWGEARVKHHIIPQDDLREHSKKLLTCGDEYKSSCWCVAVVDEEGTIVHNAMDRREDYEISTNKLS